MQTHSLSGKDVLAMSYFEATPARTVPAPGTGWLGRMIRAIQYGRMCSALDQLSDDQLDMIGLKRGEIARHARKIVYDQQA